MPFRKGLYVLHNFKKLKIQETKLYVWNIIFACFINLNKMPLKIEIQELLFAQQA